MIEKLLLIILGRNRYDFINGKILENNKKSIKSSKAEVVAIQTSQNIFNFIVLGLIGARIYENYGVRTTLIDLVGVNAAVGNGLTAFIKRGRIFNWLRSRVWEKEYARHAPSVGYRSSKSVNFITSIKLFISSVKYWQAAKSVDNFHLVHKKIQLDDLIIDTYLRFKPSPKFNSKKIFTLYLIWRALSEVEKAGKFFEENSPKLYMCAQTAYIEQGVFSRVALEKGIIVWTIGNFYKFAKNITKNSKYDTSDSSRYRSDFKKLENKEIILQEAEKNLLNRFRGAIDPAISYMQRSVYEAEVNKKNFYEYEVVVFLHDFYDSPHIYDDLVFQDFWTWACVTIDTLLEIDVKFALKPHPNQIGLSKEALMKLKLKYPSVVFLDTKINNIELTKGDLICGITMYGSISHELAYFGIPTIACAKNPHHSFGFCKTAQSIEEYKNYIKNIQKMNFDKAELKKESLEFYHMHNNNISENERVLRDKYIKLWRSCNVGDVNADEILGLADELKKSTEFDEFVANIMK